MTLTNKQNLVLGITAVLILAAIAWVTTKNTNSPSEDSSAIKAADVLSPEIFADEKTRAAYQAAKDYPEVIEQMPCFCGCKEGFNHDNNLFCFKDQHGAG